MYLLSDLNHMTTEDELKRMWVVDENLIWNGLITLFK